MAIFMAGESCKTVASFLAALPKLTMGPNSAGPRVASLGVAGENV
jgi:hypothetical protein